MAKKMNVITIILMLATILSFVLWWNAGTNFSMALTITFGTITYHFIMRLIVGHIVDLLLDNHMNYRAKWFQVTNMEQNLYEKLRVKKWKSNVPTYDGACFDKRIHTWDEIAQAMCQAELVHEIIVVLSFVPILASIPFGGLVVFVITSVLAACFDAIFIVIQRYNRPRIVKLINNDELRKDDKKFKKI